MQKMNEEEALLISASGIHADGWTNTRATLAIACNRPLQLFFYLPLSPFLSKIKAVYVKHNRLQYKVEVVRGAITPSVLFAPINDTVALEIDCEYADINAGREQTEFGVQVAQLAPIGETPSDFISFLSGSYESARAVNVKRREREVSVNQSSRPMELMISDGSHGCLKIISRGSSDNDLRGNIFIDGVSVGAVVLTKSNDHAVRNEHTIDWNLPKDYCDGLPHVCSFELNEGSSVFRTDPIVVQHPQFRGELDQIDYSSLTGWVYHIDQASPIWLDVHVNGSLQKTVEASEPRPDVKQVMGSKIDRVGFRFDFEAARTAHSNVVTIVDEETKIPIFEVTIADPYRTLTHIATKYRKEFAINDVNAVLSTFQSLAPSSPATTVKKRPIRRTAVSQREVAVVIPMYGGAAETAECLESVLQAQNITSCKYILVNDGSPDAIINELVDTIAQEQGSKVIVIRRQRNGGFSSSVNLGIIAAGNRDVILLNSDTVVSDGWIDRLAKAASSDSAIGTVTPLTNNGEIVSLPYQCRSLVVDDLSIAKAVDRAAAMVNATTEPIDIPVAIGFCMYVKRECLDEIGMFDAELWGRGYGEEVDFCLKARVSGWRHVVATDTFVVHRGNASFGDEKLQRIVESARKISEIYPFYNALIQRFIAEDPIRTARQKINLSVIDGELGTDRILHVTHSFGGGTEKYVRDVVKMQREKGMAPLIVRFNSTQCADLEIDLSGTNLEGLFDMCHVETFARNEISELKDKLTALKIERIHLHSPFGLPKNFLDWLTTNYRFDVTVHDYAWICPRATLNQPGGRYCGEPSVEKCDSCTSVYLAHRGLSELLSDCNRSVADYRDFLHSVLQRAERVTVGADDVRVRLQKHGVGASFLVTPHPESNGSKEQRPKRERRSDGRVRVALFGAISEIKGFHKLIACARYAQENMLPISFIVFGYTMNDSLASSIGNIVITGRYEDEDLDQLIQDYSPDVSFFPNQWPETYSYTLSHSCRAKIWPVVTDLGAPAERVIASGFGAVIPYDLDEAAICVRLLEACQNGALKKRDNAAFTNQEGR